MNLTVRRPSIPDDRTFTENERSTVTKRGQHTSPQNVGARPMTRVVKLIEKYSPILTIAAMLIAVYQLWVVHRSAGDIDNLSRSAATRYINKFPNNMPDLTALMKLTDEEILIACDFAPYGNLSPWRDFELYFAAIKKLRSEKKSAPDFLRPEYRQHCSTETVRRRFRENQGSKYLSGHCYWGLAAI